MILNYNECLKKYGNLLAFNKALKNKILYKIEKGIYSEKSFVSELEIIVYKNKSAIFTSESAYYYQDLTDHVPDKYYMATEKDAYKIRDKRVKQFFYLKKQLNFGIEKKEYNGIEIKIFDKERLLIDLIRKKNVMPFDYYKEIINSYRDISEQLDVSKIQNYLSNYNNKNKIYENLMLEVF